MKPSETEDLYARLGINKTGGLEDIAKSEIVTAYRNIAKQYHPDLHPPSEKDFYEREFIAVTEAYETLKADSTRERYQSAKQYEHFNFAEAHKRYMDFVSMLGEKFPELAAFLKQPDISREVLLMDNLFGGLFGSGFGFSDFKQDKYDDDFYLSEDKEQRDDDKKE